MALCVTIIAAFCAGAGAIAAPLSFGSGTYSFGSSSSWSTNSNSNSQTYTYSFSTNGTNISSPEEFKEKLAEVKAGIKEFIDSIQDAHPPIPDHTPDNWPTHPDINWPTLPDFNWPPWPHDSWPDWPHGEHDWPHGDHDWPGHGNWHWPNGSWPDHDHDWPHLPGDWDCPFPPGDQAQTWLDQKFADYIEQFDKVKDAGGTYLTTADVHAGDTTAAKLAAIVSTSSGTQSSATASTSAESSKSSATPASKFLLGSNTENSSKSTGTSTSTYGGGATTSFQSPGTDAATLAAGLDVSDSLGGGASKIGGADVVFEQQAGGVFSSQYFKASNAGDLLAAIGSDALKKIDFATAGDLAQGWELHFDGDFSGSVFVTLGYDEGTLPPGFDESTLKLMHYVATKGLWEVPEDFLVDTLNNQFSFRVDSFSPFVLAFENEAENGMPEPAAGSMLALQMALLFWWRRRR